MPAMKNGTPNSMINKMPMFLGPPNPTRYAKNKQKIPITTEIYGPVVLNNPLM